MCDVLKLPRSTYYYEENKVEVTSEDELTSLIMDIFQSSRQNYGTRKIKKELYQQGLTVSRRRIGRIMKELGLVSSYTVAQYKPIPRDAMKPSKRMYWTENLNKSRRYLLS